MLDGVQPSDMNPRILLWAPRIAGLALSAFFAMFALGAQGSHSVVDVVMHLAPTLLMVALVTLGWRRPLLAGVGMLALSVLYVATTRRLDWALVIAGPLMIAGLLYLASWSFLKRSALVAVFALMTASPASSQAPPGDTASTSRGLCWSPAPRARCRAFIQQDGGFALSVFGRESTLLDSTRASSSGGPFGAAPLPVGNLPSYVGWDLMAMKNTNAAHALGVSVHAGLMMGFMTEGGSDFLVRSAVSLRRRTWWSSGDYRDLSVGVLVAQVEKLRHPSGPAWRPGVNASATWSRKRLSLFASMDVVHADVEPRVALHGGLKVTGAKPLLAATALGAALVGLFNMPI